MGLQSVLQFIESQYRLTIVKEAGEVRIGVPQVTAAGNLEYRWHRGPTAAAALQKAMGVVDMEES